MSNRPHSREKRVSNASGSVNKQSFSSAARNIFKSAPHARQERTSNTSGFVNKGIFNSTSRPHSRPERESNYSSSVHKQDFSSFSSVNNSGFNNNNNNKKSKFSLKNILLLIVVFFIMSYLFRILFSSPTTEETNNNSYEDNTVNYTSGSNSFIENHTTTYDNNTSSNDVNYEVSNGTRDKFTKILGGGKDKATVMVYMIGTDLESSSAAGTYDINEMLKADLDGNINVILETGGCKKWQNNIISSNYIERYAITSRGFEKIDSLNSSAMTNPNNLTDFINYCANNFPANRYMLVLWDHGGGSVTGFGYDEKYPRTASMSPDLIGDAIGNSKVKFDFIGFDACLMANLETAIAIEPYADYMIGSEETEPGGGWYYTNWLKALDSNTSIATIDLGKKIVDDYVKDSVSQYRGVEVTQSVIDLGELVANIKEPLTKFSSATATKLESNDYQEIANARGRTKEFSKSSKLDQVDLVNLATNFNVDGSKELVNAIKSAVKYNRAENISNSYGLSAYFPYSSLSKMNQMVKIYDNININKEYSDAIKSFATIASSGQIVTQNSGSSSSSLFDMLMGNSYSGENYTSNDVYSLLNGSLGGSSYNDNYYDYYGYGNEGGYNSYSSILGGDDSWIDSNALDYLSLFFGRDHLVDSNSLNIIEKNGKRVVSLTDSQWDLIESVQLNMYADDGEGYIDLGMDNIFEFDEDGDLIVESDGTWLSINNHFV
ncbi:MAG: peptidase C11, partial [Firmicutes bacterium]|nr:peptidase C11 [Candidatus Colivicinus equi]